MAIANPASPQVGPEPESQNEPKGQPESSKIDAGVSLEATPAVAAPTIPVGTHAAVVPDISGVLMPVAVAEPEIKAEAIAVESESSASHLAGLAASALLNFFSSYSKIPARVNTMPI